MLQQLLFVDTCCVLVVLGLSAQPLDQAPCCIHSTDERIRARNGNSHQGAQLESHKPELNLRSHLGFLAEIRTLR